MQFQVLIDGGQRLRVQLADRVNQELHAAEGRRVAARAACLHGALPCGLAERLAEEMKRSGCGEFHGWWGLKLEF